MISTQNAAIEALHRAMREAREAKKSLDARLVELEAEAAMLRSQVSSLNAVIEQTSSALKLALFPAENPVTQTPVSSPSVPLTPPVQSNRNFSPADTHQAALELEDLESIDAGVTTPPVSGNVRFNDFRIPQAATVVLREAGRPLHVSEIYQRMAEGGFEFRGQHQLITLAVSLSRAKRFRKVAPGTFELDQRYATGQVA